MELGFLDVFLVQGGPELVLGWRMVFATLLAVIGASLGSVGGVGGGGIFVPMLILVCGFDAKTAPALSKCMIFAQCASTVAFNFRLKRSGTDVPLIDYDLALLFQPMLLLGVSIGVSFNVVFPEWLITLLLIILTLAVATRSFQRALAAWKQETIRKKALEEASQSEQTDNEVVVTAESLCSNVRWMQLLFLLIVWCCITGLQLLKTFSAKCSIPFWIYNCLQIPVTVAATALQAVRMHKNQLKKGQALLESGKSSSASASAHLDTGVFHVARYAGFGVLAGAIAGLLGVGGGATLGPIMLEFGVPPQTVSATAILIMFFSSSLTVLEFYLLDRIPVSFALYFGLVCIIAAFLSQKLLQKLITWLGRTSIIIFALVLVVFVSGITLGGSGIVSTIQKLKHREYMGFGSMCQ